MKKRNKIILSLSLTILTIISIFTINFFIQQHNKENFYRDYNNLNEDYKKVLFSTGQEKNDSISLFEKYEINWNIFYNKYRTNQISDFKNDKTWTNKLDELNKITINTKEKLKLNEIHESHLELEKIRNKWQEIFLDNNVSLIGTYLTDFHDKIEIAIELNENEFTNLKLSNQCEILKKSLNEINNLNVKFESDYTEKLEILNNSLNQFCQSKTYDEYENNSSNLKKKFISLYLKYG